ncbi:oligopeptide ABC transporter permease OppB [Mesoplasma lactucae]|uniref:ABC transporter permease n=1 Tax=Mesoplasma lactucae ATCC 49193 TaxID=81460 RepID=A0A291IRD3_9MOLU|nr:oligopeptide ABC transporter permease OppB [Mesoplasma lactucae]ATG97247.1 ABC transporter permease [Mesoplasma lactucae ATCC 49193]ATZ20307.1 oligopeptide ABC transporter permease [Mesoplasma lactucae ATCC 49193]MCL8216478.1 hypothetical protein [Mesoplasma lactucae ATCC 49193]
MALKETQSESNKPLFVEQDTKPVTVEDLNSMDFDLSDEMVFAKDDWLTTMRHKWEDFSANVYKFYIAHPLLNYSIRRIFYGLITLLVAIIVVFLLVRVVTNDDQYLPSNIAQLHLNEEQTAQLLENRMKAFGVYGSLGHQLGNYLKNIFPLIPKTVVTDQVWENQNGQAVLMHETTKKVWVYLGVVTSESIASPGTPVMEIFNKAIPYSFAFGAVAVVISYLIGLPLGIHAAKKKDKASDDIINGTSVFLTAVPAAVVVIGIYLLAIAGFGTSGLFSSGSFWTKFWPVVTLIILIMPANVIMTRRYVVDEMTNDYTRFAYSQGLSTNRVFYIQIFRNAGIRILKQFPIDLAATLFGSSILVEQQWSIPGMSRYIVSAIGGQKDSFVILGFISFAAFIQIFASLISDLLVVWWDPRVSLGKK